MWRGSTECGRRTTFGRGKSRQMVGKPSRSESKSMVGPRGFAVLGVFDET
jgi:hypothetical protein